MEVAVRASSVSGVISAPSSKSAMQRAVACALMAEGRSEIINPSYSEDALCAMEMAECLGAEIKRLPDRVIVEGGYRPVCSKIYCGESGLGARIFSVLSALNTDWIEVHGSGSMLSRPVHMLEQTLSQMGAEVITSNGLLPIKVKGPLKGGLVFVDGSLSSQFLTGLLIALPILDSDSRIIVNNLKSKPYIDLTINILNRFGIEVINENYEVFNVPGSQKYRPVKYTIEGDWSGTAFLFVLGAIAGEVRVRGLSYMSTQPDLAIIDILRKTGAAVEIKENDIQVKRAKLNSFETDITDCPDLAPPLAVLASLCHGKTVIRGTERLKVKESNRGDSLMTELSKMGVRILNYDDRIEVEGPSVIRGAKVDSHGDHRISMALAILSVVAGSRVIITGAESVNKSYPSFFGDLLKLGVKLEITE
ncbi:MAG: 3-phosphoshikimate 1-carboxyvinyltransferase [Bacteroidales bacterium]|nr:3-phosphoshikimate 1-carboxyvinyltransferase [Bacteroidales bacterium]